MLNKAIVFVVICISFHCLLWPVRATEPNSLCDPILCWREGRHAKCGGLQNNTCDELEAKPKTMGITERVKKSFVEEHNLIRSMISFGKLKPFRKATRMLLVKWDDTLADLALLNAMECNLELDQCRNTHRWRHVGQSTLLVADGGYENRPEDSIPYLIKKWSDQKLTTRMNDVWLNPKEFDPSGNFLQIINDRVEAIGCAVVTWRGFIRLTCNYSHSNVVGVRIYQPGETCAMCPDWAPVCSIRSRQSGLCVSESDA